MMYRIVSVLALVALMLPGVDAFAADDQYHIKYFTFREGKLEWETVNNSLNSETKKPYPTTCLGKTLPLLPSRKTFVEDIDGDFAGELPMTPEDKTGKATGSYRIKPHPYPVRYELHCFKFMSNSVDIRPSDWPSGQRITEFPSLNTSKSAQLKNSKVKSQPSKNVTAREMTKKEKSSIPVPKTGVVKISVPKRVNFTTYRPGDERKLVGDFDLVTTRPIRLTELMIEQSNKGGVFFGDLKVNIDGKEPTSFSPSKTDKGIWLSGLNNLGLAFRLEPGKHRIKIYADIYNPPKPKNSKNTIASSYLKITEVRALAGLSERTGIKAPLNLQPVVLKYRPLKPTSSEGKYAEYADQK